MTPKERKKLAFSVIFFVIIAISLSFIEHLQKEFDSPIFIVLFVSGGLLLHLILGSILEHGFKNAFHRIRWRWLRKLLSGEHDEHGSATIPCSFKQQLLFYTIKQYENREANITNREIFNELFPIYAQFFPGTLPVNKEENWLENAQQQFLIITGGPGSGKSLELINRLKLFCKRKNLELGQKDYNFLSNEKIPLYIELGSLKRALDDEWIIEYIRRSANILDGDKTLDEEFVEAIIKKENIIYFFDGIDEIDLNYREKSIKKIIKYSRNVGVCATCRKDVYKDLQTQTIIPKNNLPAEFLMKPISEEWIETIISETEYPQQEKDEMARLAKTSPVLMEHLSRPIILNLFITVYPHLSYNEKNRIEHDHAVETLGFLWKKYEDIIFVSKLRKDDDILKLRTYTVWMAKIMKGNPFFAESIQPNWLSKINNDYQVGSYILLQKLFYLNTRIIACIIIGFALACIVSTPFALISNSILGGIAISVISGIYKLKHIFLHIPAITSKILLFLFLTASLVIICGTYQGLSVPRADEDMAPPLFFMRVSIFSYTESWCGVLLGLILSAVFAYRIILEKDENKYILPLKLFNFDWLHALTYSLTWSSIVGVIVAGLALYVKHHYVNSLFINKWLIPYLNEISMKGKSIFPKTSPDSAIFIYAFLVVSVAAFLLLLILSSQYKNKVERDDKKQKLDFGGLEIIKHAIIHSLLASAIVFILYYVTLIRMDIGNWFFDAKITLGVFTIAFLWYGGMEVINHALLTLTLYTRGIAPLNYAKWFIANQRMALIRPTGYQMEFLHSTLAGYYKNYNLKNNPRIRLKKNIKIDVLLYWTTIFLFICMLSIPFLLRYTFNGYWKSSHDIKVELQDVKKDNGNDSDYVMQKTGLLYISVAGHINVGTFVGWVLPCGTRRGFVGMPIKSAYNFPGLDTFRHAAILFRRSTDGINWSRYHYLSNKYRYRDTTSIEVTKGDKIQFIVNDREYQNNFWRYKVKMWLCNNCK